MTRSADEDEVRRIYRETIDALYAFVSRRCGGDRDLAEDVTQETWLRAVRAWRTDGVPERPLAWLSTVAARLLSNDRRRPAPARLDNGAGDAVPSPDQSLSRVRAARRSIVERAMQALPALQLQLIESFHFEQRPIAEIATSLGLSPRGVEGRLRRARQRLREIVEADPDTKETMP